MDPRDNAAPVTRGEFLSALALVWTFIMLAFARMVFGSERTPVNGIYLAASFVMVVGYAAAALRNDLSRKKVIFAVVLAAVALAVGAAAFIVGRASS